MDEPLLEQQPRGSVSAQPNELQRRPLAHHGPDAHVVFSDEGVSSGTHDGLGRPKKKKCDGLKPPGEGPIGTLVDVFARISTVPVLSTYLAISFWYGSDEHDRGLGFWGIFRGVLNVQVALFTTLLVFNRMRARGAAHGGAHVPRPRLSTASVTTASTTSVETEFLWKHVLRMYCTFDVLFMLLCCFLQTVFNICTTLLAVRQNNRGEAHDDGAVFIWAPILDTMVHFLQTFGISYCLRVKFVGKNAKLPKFAVNMLIVNHMAMAIQNIFFVMHSLSSLCHEDCGKWKMAYDIAIGCMPFTVELRIHYIFCLIKIQNLDHEQHHVAHLCGEDVRISSSLWRTRVKYVVFYIIWIIANIAYCVFINLSFKQNGLFKNGDKSMDWYYFVLALLALVLVLLCSGSSLATHAVYVLRNPGSSRMKDAGFVFTRMGLAILFPILVTLVNVITAIAGLSLDEAMVLWGLLAPWYPVICIILWIRLFRAILRRGPAHIPISLSFEDEVLLWAGAGQVVLRMMEIIAFLGWENDGHATSAQMSAIRWRAVAHMFHAVSDVLAIVAVLLLTNLPKWGGGKLDKHVSLILASFGNLIVGMAVTGIMMARAETQLHMDHHSYSHNVMGQYVFDAYYGPLGKYVQMLLFPIRVEFSLLLALFSVNICIRLVCSVGAYCQGKACRRVIGDGGESELTAVTLLDKHEQEDGDVVATDDDYETDE